MSSGHLAGTIDGETAVVIAELLREPGEPWWASNGQRGPEDDFLFMDEIAGCAIERLGLHPGRIHSTGFSSGGEQAAQTGLWRSGYLASIALMSGFRTGIPNPQDPDNKYPVMIIHGGPTSIISPPEGRLAEVMRDLWASEGHFTIICNHDTGHRVPEDVEAVWQFFVDHPYGTVPSPYAAGLPAGMPAYCELRDESDCGVACPPAPDWSCLGSEERPTATETPTAVSFRVVEHVSLAPLEGARLEVCAIDDLDCRAPIDRATTDTNGNATVTVPLGATGLEGYVQVSSTPFYPIVASVDPVVVDARDGPLVLQAFTPLRVDFYATVLAARPEVDPSRGHVRVNVLDCGTEPAAGVVVSLDTADADTGRFYVEGIVTTAVDHTGVEGIAAFMNVPAGPATATAVDADSGDAIGTVDFFVRGGAMHEVYLVPYWTR